MTDATLISLGAGIFFVAAAGAYIYLRDRFMAPDVTDGMAPVPASSRKARPSLHSGDPQRAWPPAGEAIAPGDAPRNLRSVEVP